MAYLTYSTSLILSFQISYHGSGEGGESDDSEGENQELAQIDRGECSLLTELFLHCKFNVASSNNIFASMTTSPLT